MTRQNRIDGFDPLELSPQEELKEINQHIQQKKKKTELEQQQEAQEIASQMTDDILMEIHNES